MNSEIRPLVVQFFRDEMMRIVCSDAKSVTLESLEPKQVKMAVVQHIEEIAPRFNETMFYAMMRQNYKAEEAETQLRQFVADFAAQNPGKTPGYMELLPFACRTEQCYTQLIDAYKDCFTQMLEGRMPEN